MSMTLLELKDAIAKAIADVRGHGMREKCEADAIAALNIVVPQLLATAPESFQSRVSDWMDQCFLPSLYSNMTERGDRLLEEVLELLQSKCYDRSRVATLVDYVWGRSVGEPSQEVGGVMVTLAGFCWIAGLNMHEAGETELARISQPEAMEKIRRKQQAKNALHFDTPLPGIAVTSETAGSAECNRDCDCVGPCKMGAE